MGVYIYICTHTHLLMYLLHTDFLCILLCLFIVADFLIMCPSARLPERTKPETKAPTQPYTK